MNWKDHVSRTHRAMTVLVMAGLAVGVSVAEAATQHRTTTHKHAASKPAASGNPVVLSAQPGTELDKQARLLNAEDIETAHRHHEEPLVLIGSAPLSTSKDEIGLFVQLQSAALCGSAGCSTDVYLKRGGEWIKVLDSVSGAISILPTRHGGMYDIVVDGSDRWIWHGDSYQDTISAAPIGNLRGEIEQFQKKEGISPNVGK